MPATSPTLFIATPVAAVEMKSATYKGEGPSVAVAAVAEAGRNKRKTQTDVSQAGANSTADLHSISPVYDR